VVYIYSIGNGYKEKLQNTSGATATARGARVLGMIAGLPDMRRRRAAGEDRRVSAVLGTTSVARGNRLM
jgi:hypothetical protein